MLTKKAALGGLFYCLVNRGMATKQISIQELVSKRFLYEGKEVRLTGRFAKKQDRRGDKYLFEIRPSDLNAPAYKDWVTLNDMYQIYHPTSTMVELAEDLVDAIRRVASKKDLENNDL